MFSDELAKHVPGKIVAELNHGSKVLSILAGYNGLLDYDLMAQMVKELKDAYSDYKAELRNTRLE